MNDLIMLMQLIRGYVEQISAVTDLARKMHDEGRFMLTAEELSGLQAADNATRDLQVAAIAQARAEGR